MSIAAMVDNEVARAAKKPPVTRARRETVRKHGQQAATRTGDVISSLASYVPTEAIAAYLVLLPFMDPSGKGYSGRWGLVAGVTILAVAYTVGYRKIANLGTGKPFKMPWVPVLTTIGAFAAWVFAIPDSPFNDFGFYTAALGGAVGTIVATGISFAGSVTGETLTEAAEEPAGGG